MKKFSVILMFLLASTTLFSQNKVNLGLRKEDPALYKSFKKMSLRAVEYGSVSLPDLVDWENYLPEPGNQEQQNSCVGWAVGYACKSFHEKIERDWNLDSENTLFSPAYIYNQINEGEDYGSFISDALELVKNQGCATLDTMDYDYTDYLTQPGQKAKQEASRYKAKNWATIDWKNDFEMKAVLASKNAVIVGLDVYDSLYEYTGGVITESTGEYYGGHAVLVMGYDNTKKAYKIMNSWGPDYGEGGFFWISYSHFKEITSMAYVMYDEVVGNPNNPPLPPDELYASEGEYADKIKISWNKSESADLYYIFRSVIGSNNFKEIGRTAITSFTDTDAEAGVSYVYAVKCENNNGIGGFSHVAEGWVKKTGSGIQPPSNLYAWGEDNTVYLEWDTAGRGYQYHVYRWDDGEGVYHYIGSTEELSYTDSGLSTGFDYWYVVSSEYKGVESDSSDAVYTTLNPPSQVPGTPQNLAASTKYKNKITLTWDPVENGYEYYLYRWNDELEEWQYLGAVDGESYTDYDVKQRSQYWYTISAGNHTGEGDYSEYALGETR